MKQSSYITPVFFLAAMVISSSASAFCKTSPADFKKPAEYKFLERPAKDVLSSSQVRIFFQTFSITKTPGAEQKKKYSAAARARCTYFTRFIVSLKGKEIAPGNGHVSISVKPGFDKNTQNCLNLTNQGFDIEPNSNVIRYKVPFDESDNAPNTAECHVLDSNKATILQPRRR